MEQVKKFSETASKIGLFGITTGFGTWFLYTGSLVSTSPNIGLCAVGAVLVISALFFDYLVWRTHADVAIARETKAKETTDNILTNPPGQPKPRKR